MFEWLNDLYAWLMSLWDNLPPKTKQKIIDAFVESLDYLLRNYFHYYKPTT